MSKHLIDMKLSRKEAEDDLGIGVSESKGPRYPYGLSISLDDDSMKKLGFEDLIAVGTKMIVVGVGKVTNASENRRQNGVDRHMTIQLEKVEVEPFDKNTGRDDTAVDAVTNAIKDV